MRMKEFVELLQQHMETVAQIGDKIEKEEPYMNELKNYLPSLNQVIMSVFELVDHPQIQLDVSKEFILQLLNDIVYGIENEDSVYLLDVLRYGLLEAYGYISAELQGEVNYE